MRIVKLGLAGLPLWIAAACGGAGSSGFSEDASVGGGDSGSGDTHQVMLTDTGVHEPDGMVHLGGDTGSTMMGEGGMGDVMVTTTITVYVNTDTQLFTMDPMTNAVTLVGTFAGTSGGSGDSTVTDLAVNAEGDVYANTETVIYKATIPSTPGTVNLTKIATIAGMNDSFYALGFTPMGVLGSGEMLVGGDGNGELWSIDPATGATQDLGNFGPVPDGSGNHFALSGDVFFYTDASGKPTGLATIRSCPPSGSSGYCTETDDYLAGIDMTALTGAYTSKKPAASLLAGIYGGTMKTVGPGTSYGRIYGLAAWEGNVYGFSRVGSKGTPPPYFLSIDTTTGAASIVSSTFPFTTGGWSGAGATTKSVVKVPPPPPPPPPPK